VPGDGESVFARVVRGVARRPLLVLAVVGLLALAGAALALRLEPSDVTDTLVDRSSESYRATQDFKRDFGDEAVVVLVRGDLQRTLLTDDLGRLIRLEGCLSGNVPARNLADQVKAGALPAACQGLSRLKPARVVYGPGTFINTAANQIGEEFVKRQQAAGTQAEAAARSAAAASRKRGDPPAQQRRLAATARNAVQQAFTQQVVELGLRYGLTSVPSIQNSDFISTLVFNSRGGRVGEPKPRFAYLFPSRNSAMIQVRFKPGLSESERARAVDLIEQATSFRPLQPRTGARYVVTGVPVVTQALQDAVQRSIVVLLIAALLIMAATLAVVFRTRLRLLPLALALAAAAMTFGALSLAGGGLTMASIAVLPVLIGLAVDYSIQFQARFDEQRAGRGGRPPPPAEAARRAAAAGGPTIATAGIATAVGFLVLQLSPVPMVRGFGALLVIGIVIALVCALTAGFAALARFSEPRERPADVPPALPRLRARMRPLTAFGGRLRDGALERGRRALDLSLTRPRRVLAVGLALAVLGFAADTQTEVISDVRELVPRDLQALKDVNALQDETGVSGEIDVTVRADDITSPAVLGWMTRFQQQVLRDGGYETGDRCSQSRDAPDLCPALSLPDILGSGGGQQSQQQVRQLLDAVPAYFSQAAISSDRTVANLAFGIRLMPLEKQKKVVERIRDRLDPPAGVSAAVVGLPVLAADANAELSSTLRRTITLLAALLGVFLVLLAFRRSARAASIPLIPIALASGWSGGVVFLLSLLPGPFRVELNPMSVTLAALVIAISTEFSVLLSARYRQEREAGAGPERAIELAYGSTGAAVLASGVTAIAGFAAVAASDIRMLRDFGIVTVVDLTVSLLGVLIVLPAAIVWAEQHGPFTLRDLSPLRLLRALRSARPSLPARRAS
jgi:hydrophobe/amphiphile efflux-3 (HAE3) family protein